jgi:hypothetical protein
MHGSAPENRASKTLLPSAQSAFTVFRSDEDRAELSLIGFGVASVSGEDWVLD